MPNKRIRVESEAICVVLNCLVCRQKFSSGKIYTNPVVAIVCGGLKKHLLHNKKCHAVHQQFMTKDGDYDFHQCVAANSQHHLKAHDPIQFPVERFGLTMTDNCPFSDNDEISSTSSNMHKTLNSQTVRQGFQSSISRGIIKSSLSRKRSISESNKTTDPSSTNIGSDTESITNSPPANCPIETDSDIVLDSDTDDMTDSMPETSIINNHPIQISSNELDTHLPSHLQVEIELMKIMGNHKMPLSCFKTIFEWAIRSQRRDEFDFASQYHVRTRKTIMKEINTHVPEPERLKDFHFELVEWLPDKKPVQISVCYFKDALSSLLHNKSVMREENLSFPDSRSPYNSRQHPEVNEMSELHHGSWWSESWDLLCTPKSKEILVPIILYMDGISIDAHGRLTLTPLNMTLGIFNIATRRKPEAWETLYFHPDHNYQSAQQSRPATSAEGLQNIHNGLRVALKSFKEVCDNGVGIQCKDLPYAGTTWDVTMKFAIAYVIGDTKLHDELCGRFGSYGEGVKKICRHCQIPTADCVDPLKQSLELWETRLLCPQSYEKEYFKNISHHPIDNVFNEFEFGCINKNKIHLASPGECLHMHQLGCAKRAVESFDYFVMKSNDIKGHKAMAKKEMETIAQSYGAMLSRQSDRDFPRVKFTSAFLSATKKEGKDYAGILLGLVVALVSGLGKETLCTKAHITTQSINSLIYTIELILFMEEFWKKGKIMKRQLGSLKKMIDHFVTQINDNCNREGMGTKLIKNHLFFHLPMYIKLWGPPTGWDSASSESHHKTEIKGPSKNTQNNASTIIEQVAKRQTEKNTICRFHCSTNDQPQASQPNTVSGSKFTIVKNLNGKPGMKWSRSDNKDKPTHPHLVIQFCYDHFFAGSSTINEVRGFTEHNRICHDSDIVHRFRCHPSYRADAGLVKDTWYDWALFSYIDNDGTEQDIPCQILCLLDLHNYRTDTWPKVMNVDKAGEYAVVRCFRAAAKPIRNSRSKIVEEGTLEDNLMIISCDSISDTVAVVQNKTIPPTDNQFFVVKNRTRWLSFFYDKLNSFDTLNN